MMDIQQIIGLEGGENACFFKVLAEAGRGKTKYWPAIKNGEEAGVFDFPSFDEYCRHKIERERETIRVVVSGNAVAAENKIREILGCSACAIGPTTVDIYPEEVTQ